MAEGSDPTSSTRVKMDADPDSTLTEFFTNCDDYLLFQLTKFYRDRLEQAIEEGVEGLALMLIGEDHFSGQEYQKVSELVQNGNRAGSSKLLLNLVMEKGPRARRMMWESFVKMHHSLRKLGSILREIQELGSDPINDMKVGEELSEIPSHLKDVQQKHKETLRVQTETLRVNTILIKEKVKIFQLVDRYAELTVISTVRDLTLVEHELLARGRDHEEWREKDLRKELEKIRTDQLFQSSFSQRKSKSGNSAAVSGVPGIGKTTMVQKIVYDWATGKIYPHFQFVFSFKFRDLNTINYPGQIGKLLSEAHSKEDGRFEIFLRFVAGLSSPQSARPLEMFLGPFLHQTTCRVIDWVKEKVEGQIGDSQTETGKRKLLNTFHYLFESQNKALARNTVGSMETLSLSGLRLTPIDCAVLSHVIGLCDTIKHLGLGQCNIQCEGLQRLGPILHKCQELSLGGKEVGDSGVKRLSAALRNPECKIQKLDLRGNNPTDSCAEDLASALSTNRSLIDLDLGSNNLGDSGVKLLSVALRNPDCKIQELGLQGNNLTDSCAEDLASALSTNRSLIDLNLGYNKLGDSGVKLLSVALRNPDCKIQKLHLFHNALTDSCAKDLASVLSTNRSLIYLNLGYNKLGDSGVKLLSVALRNPECKIQELGLDNTALTDSCAEDLASALSTKQTLRILNLGLNSFTDQSVPALRRLILTCSSLEEIELRGNQFSPNGERQLEPLQESRPGLSVTV
ncbi:uncharacterized protein LOC144487736 [Mustelus asterias]